MEAYFKWVLTSTGASTTVFDNLFLRNCRAITVTTYTDGGANTAAFGIEVGPNSTGPFVRFGSTSYALSSGGAVSVLQMSGPIMAIRPYFINRQASTTRLLVELTGVS